MQKVCIAKSTKKLINKTPHKAWIGVRPSIGHFKVFGLLCLRHVPTHSRRKLDDRSQSMNFLGYHSAGAYKLYSPTRNNMVTSRDGQFDKAKSWNWSGNVVHRDVAASGVTTVLEEDNRNVFIGEHALGGLLKHNSCSQKMLVLEALRCSKSLEAEKLQVLKKLKREMGVVSFDSLN